MTANHCTTALPMHYIIRSATIIKPNFTVADILKSMKLQHQKK